MTANLDTSYFVIRTAKAFMRVTEAQLRPTGLGVAHLPVLVILSEEEPLTQAQIAQRIHVEQPTAATLLQRMEKAGLIEKSPDPHDRRATQISLSPHALEVLPGALDLLAATNSAATADLTGAELEVLHALLHRVLANLVTIIEDERSATGTMAPSTAPPAKDCSQAQDAQMSAQG